jgi:hypothetical protein
MAFPTIMSHDVLLLSQFAVVVALVVAPLFENNDHELYMWWLYWSLSTRILYDSYKTPIGSHTIPWLPYTKGTHKNPHD